MEKIIKDKKKIVIILIAVITILVLIVSTIVIKPNIVQSIMKLANANETQYSSTEPYVPEGFTHTEGTYDTGYVIRDNETGNEFVWIPVDGTNIKLERKDFEVTEVSMSSCSDNVDETFLESVEDYGGYYVGRYEAGVPKDSNFSEEEDFDSTGKPQIKQGTTIWNNINYLNAQTSAEQMYASNPEIASSIMNSYAYDTMLSWLESKGYNVKNNSISWGNYLNNSYTNQRVETAGSNERWKANNIYDVAGNVSEWTSEESGSNSIYRGGDYYTDGSAAPAGTRESGNKEKVSNSLGFRPIIYKIGDAITGSLYQEPYIPEGFTHTEGEWNTGYVIKEQSTGNEFVWIPVDGYNVKLDRSEFETTFCTMGKSSDTLNYKFKNSVYKNGGYYVGRYEAGVGTTSGNNEGVPVSKKGVEVWTNISRTQAQTNARKMYENNEEINSLLMSSYSYDTMLNFLKKAEYSISTYNVDTDSSTWGNYKNNTNSNNSKKLSGSNENWKANNIYDLAGNVWEWTTENYSVNSEAIARGGDYLSNGNVLPAGARDNAVANSTFDYTGYRVVMYKNIVRKTEEEVEKTKLAGGYLHSMLLDEQGDLWTWGRNNWGQIGNGTTNDVSTPQKITNTDGTKWKEVAAGHDHSIAIDEQGNLWIWGRNSYGQLGNGDISITSSNIPTKIENTDGTKWKKVAAGFYHSMAIDESGNLWVWGHNSSGQLGNGESGSSKRSTVPIKIENSDGAKWIQISAGSNHSIAIDEEGSLWTWGANNYGQLGNEQSGSGKNSTVPIRIDNSNGTEWSKVSAGSNHNIAIDVKGNLWTWGYNHYGQVGNGSVSDAVSIPTMLENGDGTKWQKIGAGSNHSLAIDKDGNLWTWGFNNPGQLGNGTTTNSLVPIKITNSEETKWYTITAGDLHSIAIDEKGTLWTWGSNSYGQLGNGESGSGKASSIPIEINY